ncbi:MAG: hypothetical protein V7K64_02445 [Nostoc sp.]|uniref:hypothetical protein n=1 Tax=unclassified Nostoc TaxID=2593658 RepID=UPI001D987ADF|nr:hypothetical protein [Nostoc sp. JL34]MBN3885622.1 hypothetical protein [Nostoc sp. JL34]
MSDESLITKPLNNDFVTLPKDLFVLNTLAMGIAIQIIAKTTGETIEIWQHYVGSTANEQYRQLSEEEIQEIVDSVKNPITA